MPFHLSDSKEQALREVADGLKRWNNEYVVGIIGRPDGKDFDDGYQAAKMMDELGGGIFGTPEDALLKLQRLQEIAGGFGTVLAFAHDWAPRDKMLKSYELVARYVMPRCQGLLDSVDQSAARVTAHKEALMAGATGAIMKAISEDERARAAMAATVAGPFNIAPAQAVKK